MQQLLCCIFFYGGSGLKSSKSTGLLTDFNEIESSANFYNDEVRKDLTINGI